MVIKPKNTPFNFVFLDYNFLKTGFMIPMNFPITTAGCNLHNMLLGLCGKGSSNSKSSKIDKTRITIENNLDKI
jgi:hypothetical protein